MKIITASINVKNIDKAYLINGEKGTYLNIVLRETKDDKYGNDFMVTQGLPKEKREEGVKGAILGNGKVYEFEDKPQQTPQQTTGITPQNNESDDLPF